MSDAPLRVLVRDPDDRVVEELGPYTSLKADLRFDGVGDWSLQVPAAVRGARLLASEEGFGVVVVREGAREVLWSGQWATCEQTYGEDGPAFSFVGADDTEVLSGELAQPDPTTAIPAGRMMFFPILPMRLGGFALMSPARRTFSGLPAETALIQYVDENIGPGAPLAERRLLAEVPVSQGRGNVGRWSERWPDLLDLSTRIAQYGPLGFRVAQRPSAAGLRLEVWQPSTRDEARFSVEAGTATGPVLTRSAPAATEVIVGGAGEGASRLLTMTASEMRGRGRRRRKWVDAASADDLEGLLAAGSSSMFSLSSSCM